jgi:uncharacterized membrane protein YqjE
MSEHEPYGASGSSQAPPGTMQHEERGTVDLTEGTEPSLPELLSATTQNLSALLRSEVELAKVELKEEAKTIGQAGAMMAIAGILGFLTLTLLCFAAAWGLSNVMDTGLAFLIVGVVVGLIAAIVFFIGRKRLEDFNPVPEQTVETIQEDVEWARQLKS